MKILGLLIVATGLLAGCAADGSFSFAQLVNGLNAGHATANAPMDPALMQQHQSVLNANQLQQMQRRGFTCTPAGNGTYYCKQ